MTTGHAWRRPTESPAEQKARQADMEYFAAHPGETSYVRRVIEGEVSDRAGEDVQAEFAAAEWVLVSMHNDGRRRRDRALLYPRGSILSDFPWGASNH